MLQVACTSACSAVCSLSLLCLTQRVLKATSPSGSLFIALPCLAEAGQHLELKACHLERCQQLTLHLQARKQVVVVLAGASGLMRPAIAVGV